jgi:CheY-like chemotaxis protein
MSPSRKKVLIADDERRWREYARNLLAADYDVEMVTDCETTVARVEQGGVDLLVLDHLMPGEEPFGTGYDVCVHLRKQHPDLPIILFTGAWEGVDAGWEELERKADAVVVFKEVRDRERDDLAARVHALLARPR